MSNTLINLIPADQSNKLAVLDDGVMISDAGWAWLPVLRHTLLRTSAAVITRARQAR